MTQYPEYLYVNASDSFEKLPPHELSGSLISIWNCLDIPEFSIRYVYLITCLVNKIKGPYCHSKRSALFCPISGSTTLVHRDESSLKVMDLTFHPSHPLCIIKMPPHVDYCLLSTTAESSIIVLCNYPWQK